MALLSLWAHLEYLEPIRESLCRQERRLHEEFSSRLAVATTSIYPAEVSPNESEDRQFLEGATRQVFVNKYERDPHARSAAFGIGAQFVTAATLTFNKPTVIWAVNSSTSIT